MKQQHDPEWHLADPGTRKWLVQCGACLRLGYRTDAPDQFMGRYYLVKYFEPLHLDAAGLCEDCRVRHLSSPDLIRVESSILLRQWTDSDLELFAAMNADPEVMRFFPRPLTIEESRQLLQRLQLGIEQRGWGLWAVEVEGQFAGFTGLSEPKFTAPFTPCVEIGWRLRREFWGRGIAFAAARQAADYAFTVLRLDELVSFTTTANARSRRLMERLGFSHDPRDDFLHPSLEEGHPLRPHVLYRKRLHGS